MIRPFFGKMLAGLLLLLTAAQAQTLLPAAAGPASPPPMRTIDVMAGCPILRDLPADRYPGVSWLIGTTTERIFTFSHFVRKYDFGPMLQDFVQVSKEVEKAGSRLILMPLPKAAMYYPHILDRTDPLIASYDFEGARRSYQQLLQQLREQGVQVLDLDAEIAHNALTTDDFFFKRDIHWTPTATERVARLLAAELREKDPEGVASLPRQTFEMKQVKQVRTGGFGSYLGTLCQTPLDPESLPLYQLQQTSEVGLLDDQQDGVVLLGDSYGGSAIDWGFAGFLARELGTPVLNQSIPAGRMSAAPIQYFLNRQPGTPMPRYIVWLFSFGFPSPEMFDQLLPSLWQCNEIARYPLNGRTQVEVFRMVRQDDLYLEAVNLKTRDNLTLTLDYGVSGPQPLNFAWNTRAYRIDTGGHYTQRLTRQGLLKTIRLSEPSSDPSAYLRLCARG